MRRRTGGRKGRQNRHADFNAWGKKSIKKKPAHIFIVRELYQPLILSFYNITTPWHHGRSPADVYRYYRI